MYYIMPFGSRTMGPSSGSSGSSITDKIVKQIGFANDLLSRNNPDEVKDRIDGMMQILLDRYKPIDVIMSNLQTPQNKIAALTALKMDGVKKFWLNLDITNSNSEYAPPVAFIQTIFNGLNPLDELVVSYKTSSRVEADMEQQIDAEIAKLETPPAKSSFFSRLGFGGRKQKRTKKGGKKSKRKTKRHKKTRSRRR